MTNTLSKQVRKKKFKLGRDYVAIGRQCFAVDHLPAGAPMWYDLDPQFTAAVVGPKGGVNLTEVETTRIQLEPIILAVYPKIHVMDVATRRFNILDREQERAQHEMAKLEDDKVFAAFNNVNLTGADLVNAGKVNAIETGTTGLTPEVVGNAFANVEQYDIPVANMVVNAQQQRDLRLWTNRNFDPVTQRELIKTGYVGDLWGKQIALGCYMQETLPSIHTMDKTTCRKRVRYGVFTPDWSLDLCYLIGVYLGAGCGYTRKRNATLTNEVFSLKCKDKDFCEAVRCSLTKLFPTFDRQVFQEGAYWRLEMINNSFGRWLKETFSRKNRVGAILKLRKERQLKAVFEGLFDSEGSISKFKSKTGSTCYEAKLGMTSEWLPTLLKHIAAHTKLKFGQGSTRKLDSGKVFHEFTVNLASMQAAQVTLNLERKRAQFVAWRFLNDYTHPYHGDRRHSLTSAEMQRAEQKCISSTQLV